MDVGFDRIGTVLGSVIILGLAAALGRQSPRVLFALAAASALAAVAVSRRLHTGYVAALEDSLRSGVVRLDLADVDLRRRHDLDAKPEPENQFRRRVVLL